MQDLQLYHKADDVMAEAAVVLFLFFSRPWSEGWPHHGRTFSIYLCPLSFWLTLPRRVLSTYWCCPSRSCVVFLACVHLTLFLALSLFPLFFSWCDHTMLDSLPWQCPAVSFCSSFVKNPLSSLRWIFVFQLRPVTFLTPCRSSQFEYSNI